MISGISGKILYVYFLLFRSSYRSYHLTYILRDSVFLVRPLCKMGLTGLTDGVFV